MKKLATLGIVFLGLLPLLSTAKDKKVKKNAQPVDTLVVISTSLGEMKVRLYKETPLHRSNFIKLASTGFYDSLLFHRVIRNFMIQGGDPLSKNAASGQMLGMGDNGYMVPAEFRDSIFHKKGSLCAARTENPEKASSGCQFYIVHGQVFTAEMLTQMESQRGMKFTDKQKQLYSTIGGSPWLDGGYTVYGEVISGLEVIDLIATVKTQPGDRPVEDVRMTMKIELVY
jgi:peptidyl-prolyl cis-trans isomerase B (cyclophilin B)